MPDLLNKQAIVNLLIDSPLREPIKINLIDIVNNTNEPDLPKVYSTIIKELEIFQKATERRMKLAEETIAKLGGTASPSAPATSDFSQTAATPAPSVPVNTPIPPLDLPPLPTPVTTTPVSMPVVDTAPVPMPDAGLTVPPLDLPPMPVSTPVAPNFQPLGAAPVSATSDENALAEIQKELDSLKTEAAADVAQAAAPVTAPQA